MNLHQPLIALLLLSAFTSVKQETNGSDFLAQLEKINVSDLWMLECFSIEDDSAMVERPCPLGFVGDNYQRMEIRFMSSLQNPTSKLLYHINGKTCVQGNICAFQGSIKITASGIYNEEDFPSLKQGYIEGLYEFCQDPKSRESGILKGIFKTHFYLDRNGELNYNALKYSTDKFANNQFEGTWTRYNTKHATTCNWGDYRIPACGKLDIGEGDFCPSKDYDEYGWTDYSAGDQKKWWEE